MKATNSKPTPTEAKALTNLQAIKAFFGDRQVVTSAELKALSKAERDELGPQCREALSA